jgi:hypothetical protein
MIAGFGLFTPFILPAGAVLMYLLRPEVAVALSGRRDYSELPPEEVELLQEENRDGAFASAIVLTLLGTLVVIAVVAFLFRTSLNPRP